MCVGEAATVLIADARVASDGLLGLLINERGGWVPTHIPSLLGPQLAGRKPLRLDNADRFDDGHRPGLAVRVRIGWRFARIDYWVSHDRTDRDQS